LPTTPIIAKAEAVFRAAIALLLASGTAAIAASAPVRPEQIPIDVHVQQARSEAAAAAAEQQRLEKAAAQARDDVTRLRARQLAAAEAIEAAEAEISAADAEALLIQARLASQRQRLAAKQAPVSSLLAGLVLASRRPPVLFVAHSGSTEDLVRLRLLVSATAPVIRARTAALSAELRRQSRLEQDVLAAKAKMAATRDDLRKRRETLATLEQSAIALASKRGSQALGAGDVALASEERFAVAEQNAQSAEASRRLASDLAALGPAPVSGGNAAPAAPFAYQLPAKAPVTDGMGAVSANGVRSRGITLATRRGTPLVAPANGTILFAGPFRGYDGILIIDHGNGWKSVIVNAGSRLHRGTPVSMGDPLGVALGQVEVQLQHSGVPVSPALIAGSSGVLSNAPKGG
jgi:septal ring factor EnvC (AmiA/AmiB activator)